MSCCTNKFRIPGFVSTRSTTDQITFPVNADVAGEFKMSVRFLDGTFDVVKEFELNDVLEFPTHGLNERFVFLAQIMKPNGDVVTYVTPDGTFDCFEFQTRPIFEL